MKIIKTHRIATIVVFGTLVCYGVFVFVLRPPAPDQWSNALVPFLTATLLLSTFLVNWKTSVSLKSVDVIIHFNKIYDEVAFREYMFLKEDPVAATDARLRQHFRRFWNLQLEQFIMFKKGYIDPDIFRYWMQCRHEEMKTNERLGSMTFKEGWDYASKMLKNTDFEIFMNHVFVDLKGALESLK